MTSFGDLGPAWNGTWVHTDAFDEWRDIDQDIRAFLVLTHDWSTKGYEAAWEEAGNTPAWDDGPELDAIFSQKVGGLWPHDHEWMLLAAVVRDSVTAFEVYLEKVILEALRRNRKAPIKDYSDRGMYWGDVRGWFRALFDEDVETEEIREIRNLRHLLTHRRGELRTEAQRQRFNLPDEDWDPKVRLDEGRVTKVLDVLHDRVRWLDALVWEQACRDRPSGHFAEVLADGRYEGA